MRRLKRARAPAGDEGARATRSAELRPFFRSLPMALLRAREAVMRHFRPSLQPFGLTEQQWRTLRALDGGDEIDATRLAALTFLLAPSLTRILRDLEARRIVARRTDPKDGRAALISLTSKGAALLAEVGVESERIYARIEERLGRTRMKALMATLAQVEADLSELAPEACDRNGGQGHR
jgi:homoprotocatechuate degradation regulator HpaR